MAKKNQEAAAPVVAAETKTPALAVAATVLGIVAAWFAAGASGFLARPLENGLTVVLLAAASVSVWPSGANRWRKRAVLGLAAAIGLALLACGGHVPAICAAAVVLAALSVGQKGIASRIVLLGAVAAGALAVFRLVCIGTASAWLFADQAGRLLGDLATAFTGRPLWIGATYSGVDLLVVMAVLYAGWLAGTEPPRMRRGLWGLGAILAAECLYLLVLAFADRLAAALPLQTPPVLDELTNRVGTWQWANALRTALPWNLPLLAVLLFAGVAWGMLSSGRWRALPAREPLSDRPTRDLLLLAATAALAALLPVVVVYSTDKPTLEGKTVVAYEHGYLGWQRPEFGRATPRFQSYGMLPMFIERLGGNFFRSLTLSDADLAKADVLVLIHPDQPWPEGMKGRILDYVRRGGSLLLVAEPTILAAQSKSTFAELLDDASIQVRYDTCMPAADRWEGCYGEHTHPVSLGVDGNRNRYGILLASSLAVRWPAVPVATGRFGHAEPGSDANASNVGRYEAGKKLGDLVLAAEQSYGKGRLFVLGDTTPLNNDTLPASYAFVGRILSELAHPSALRPQAWWRDMLGVLLAAILMVAVLWRPEPERLALIAVVMAGTFAAVQNASRASGAVMPDGRGHTPNDVAYIDASHLGAYSPYAWSNMGLGNLCRVLSRAGYLPLMLDEMNAERLERAAVLISVAPQRPFTADETRVVDDFVGSGGLLVACCGAEEAAGSRQLLSAFDFQVASSPVSADSPNEEPAPLGALRKVFGDGGEGGPEAYFYAAWPIESSPGATPLLTWRRTEQTDAVVVSRAKGGGNAVLIADSLFAVNANLPDGGVQPSGNEQFWRWLLGEATGRRLPARAMPPSNVVPEPDELLDPDAPLESDATKGGR